MAHVNVNAFWFANANSLNWVHHRKKAQIMTPWKQEIRSTSLRECMFLLMWEYFLKPHYPLLLLLCKQVVNTYTPGKKIWLEGVVTTSAGGTNNLSDSYAAGFLWVTLEISPPGAFRREGQWISDIADYSAHPRGEACFLLKVHFIHLSMS